MAVEASPARAAAAAGPQSVGRVFAVLDYLVAHRDGATLSELATFCDAPRTSLLGLLNGMLQEGCLARPPGGRYRLGPRVIGLAMRCEDRKPVLSSPEAITSSASSRRSGKAASVARVPSITGSIPMLTLEGVSTAQRSP